MATTFNQSCYRYKRNCTEREPTSEEKANLQYPKDRFELLSVDRVYEWDQPRTNVSGKHAGYRYMHRMKSVWITVKCARCGTVKTVADNPRMGCKQGPCHQKFIDWTGKKVNRLTPIRYIKTRYRKGSKEGWYWECLCECGKVALVKENQLHFGSKKECPSCGRKTAAEKTRLPKDAAKWHRWYRQLKHNAEIRGYALELSFDEARDLSENSVCHYCGCLPQRTSYGICSLGLDRLDNTKGYIRGNVVPCCGRCNTMKMQDSEQEFLQRIATIARHRNVTLNDYPEKEYTQAGGKSEHPEKGEDIV